MGFFKNVLPSSAPDFLGGAVGGALQGLAYSAVGGGIMEGDQSQLAGMAFGALGGMLTGGGRVKTTNAYNKNPSKKLFAKGVGFDIFAGTSGLIGSTVLESNQPLNKI